MTEEAPIQVVRRSALEAIHAGLGARWVAPDVHWPAGYGEDGPDADLATVAGSAGLAEIGPFEELLLRGPGAAAAAGRLAANPGATVGHATGVDLRGEPGSAWFLGPDEVLLLGPAGGAGLAALDGELASDEVSAVEMSGARTTIRLAGPAAPAIMAELCPADTTPATMAPGDLIQAPFAAVRGFIVREDTPDAPGYTIMVARDEAAFVWESIVHVGQGHGLAPVAPAAVMPAPRPTVPGGTR